jgi:hypothetical protein
MMEKMLDSTQNEFRVTPLGVGLLFDQGTYLAALLSVVGDISSNLFDRANLVFP